MPTIPNNFPINASKFPPTIPKNSSNPRSSTFYRRTSFTKLIIIGLLLCLLFMAVQLEIALVLPLRGLRISIIKPCE